MSLVAPSNGKASRLVWSMLVIVRELRLKLQFPRCFIHSFPHTHTHTQISTQMLKSFLFIFLSFFVCLFVQQSMARSSPSSDNNLDGCSLTWTGFHHVLSDDGVRKAREEHSRLLLLDFGVRSASQGGRPCFSPSHVVDMKCPLHLAPPPHHSAPLCCSLRLHFIQGKPQHEYHEVKNCRQPV